MPAGGILVFLSGKKEIDLLVRRLRNRFGRYEKDDPMELEANQGEEHSEEGSKEEEEVDTKGEKAEKSSGDAKEIHLSDLTVSLDKYSDKFGGAMTCKCTSVSTYESDSAKADNSDEEQLNREIEEEIRKNEKEKQEEAEDEAAATDEDKKKRKKKEPRYYIPSSSSNSFLTIYTDPKFLLKCSYSLCTVSYHPTSSKKYLKKLTNILRA